MRSRFCATRCRPAPFLPCSFSRSVRSPARTLIPLSLCPGFAGNCRSRDGRLHRRASDRRNCRRAGRASHVRVAAMAGFHRSANRPGQWFAEGVATFGLLLTIFGCIAARRPPCPTRSDCTLRRPIGSRLRLVRQSGGDDCTVAFRHFCRHCAGRRGRLHRRAVFRCTVGGRSGALVVYCRCEHTPKGRRRLRVARGGVSNITTIRRLPQRGTQPTFQARQWKRPAARAHQRF